MVVDRDRLLRRQGLSHQGRQKVGQGGRLIAGRDQRRRTGSPRGGDRKALSFRRGSWQGGSAQSQGPVWLGRQAGLSAGLAQLREAAQVAEPLGRGPEFF